MYESGPEGRGTGALVAQRSRGHVVYRAMSRVYVANAGSSTTRDRRVAFAAGVAIDAASWAVLKRDTAFNFGPRLAIDLADVHLFGRRVQQSPEAALLIGVPLAAEAGLRSGWLGFTVPAAHLAVATALRRRRGQRTPPGSVMPQLQGAAVGAVTGWYTRRTFDQISTEHEYEATAQAEAAGLAGQYDLAVQAGSVVDRVSGIEYLMAVAGGAPIGEGRSMARWKAAVAAASTAEATYLRVVVSRWESDRRGHRLDADVVADVDAASGTVVLTRGQADRLTAALDALGLTGHCTIRARAGDARTTGQALIVEAGAYEVVLDADGGSGRRIEPGPALAAAGAGWALALSLKGHGRVPLPVALGAASSSIALGLWLDRALRSETPPSPRSIVVVATVLATVQALVASRTRRAATDPDGVQVIPGALTFMAPAVLGGRYHRAPNGPAPAMVAALLGTGLAVSVLPDRSEINLHHLAAGAGELIAAFLLFSQLQGALDEEHLRQADQFIELRSERSAAAFAEGRARALDLVASEVAVLRRAAHGGTMPSDLREEIERRLDVVSSDLAVMR